jgi:hypothetical protein
MTLHKWYQTIGQKGGQSRTPAKVQASRENGQQGGRPIGKYHKYNSSPAGKKRKKKYQAKFKTLVFQHYGNTCARCKFKILAALTIDHINGKGNAHRRSLGRIGKDFYRWLVKSKFPSGYQTLCMNCQFIKREENHECTG